MGLLLRATTTCRTTPATTTSSVAAASDTAPTESVYEIATEDTTTTTQLPVLRQYLKVPIETVMPPSFTSQPSRDAGLNAHTLPTPDKRGPL